MRLRADLSRVTRRRSTAAIAGVLALAFLIVLPKTPNRQDVARQYPPSPSAAEESGISEPIVMSDQWVRSATVDSYKPRAQISGGHQTAPKGTDSYLTTPATRRDPSSITEEARIVGDSAVSQGGPSGSGVLTPHDLQSRLAGEVGVEGVEGTTPVVRSDSQSTGRTPLFTPPVLLSLGSMRYPPEGYRIIVDHAASAPGVAIDAAEGRVGLKILVRADGSVGSVEVAHSSGRSSLDAAAVREVSRWKFTPATRDGQPIDAWAFVPLLFVLR